VREPRRARASGGESERTHLVGRLGRRELVEALVDAELEEREALQEREVRESGSCEGARAGREGGEEGDAPRARPGRSARPPTAASPSRRALQRRARLALRAREERQGTSCGWLDERKGEGRGGPCAPLKKATAACSLCGASSSDATSATWACWANATSAASERVSCGRGEGVSERSLGDAGRGGGERGTHACWWLDGGDVGRGREEAGVGACDGPQPGGLQEEREQLVSQPRYAQAGRATREGRFETHLLALGKLGLLPDRPGALALVVRQRLEVAVVRVRVCASMRFVNARALRSERESASERERATHQPQP